MCLQIGKPATMEKVQNTANVASTAASKIGARVRMTEGNTCYRGGKPGVSDVFADRKTGDDGKGAEHSECRIDRSQQNRCARTHDRRQHLLSRRQAGCLRCVCRSENRRRWKRCRTQRMSHRPQPAKSVRAYA